MMLNSKPAANETSDERLWNLWFGFMSMPAVALADELDLFEKIHQRPLSAKEISGLYAFDTEAGLDWLHLLQAQGYLIEDSLGLFHLSEDSTRFFLRESDFYWGGALQYAYQSVKKWCPIRKALWSRGSEQFWDKIRSSSSQTKLFAKAMENHVAFAADLLAREAFFSTFTNLMDLGSGAGFLAKSIHKHHPSLKICLVDFEEVQAVSDPLPENLSFCGQDLWQTPWPLGYENILLSNYIHDLVPSRVKDLLKKAHDYLPSGGKLLILDVFKDKQPSFIACAFSLYLRQILGSQVYAFQTMDQMLAQAGFQVSKLGKYGVYELLQATKL